jgi:DNA uptake protein ComE-like DNA-binding protein
LQVFDGADGKRSGGSNEFLEMTPGEDRNDSNPKERVWGRMASFRRQLANLLKARFPLIYIPTWEEERVLEVIRSTVKDVTLIRTPRKMFVWTVTKGVRGEGVAAPDDTRAPLKALEWIEKFQEPSVFVLCDFHVYFGAGHARPDYEVIRKLRDLALELKRSPRPKSIIFISPTQVLPDDLHKDVTILDFALPTFEEIRDLLEEMIRVNSRTGRIVIENPERIRGNGRTGPCPAIFQSCGQNESAVSSPFEHPSKPSVIDLNRASEEELASLPGMNLILAKNAIKKRSEKDGFSSVEDFAHSLGLKPHVTERIRRMATAHPLFESFEPDEIPPGGNGRIVDF